MFMITGSNEQLQQEFKYTLLKPGCHSWWISKMQSEAKKKERKSELCLKKMNYLSILHTCSEK